MDPQPLKPLNSGTILIVGGKASNFDNEILTNPRVIMWDSQREDWTNKDIPTNTRAVFVTKWVGHSSFANIIRQTRKRHITLFNLMGTGIITQRVKELLGPKPEPIMPHIYTVNLPDIVTEPKEETKTMGGWNKGLKGTQSKLHVLIPYIDWNKTNTVNAELLMIQAEREGIKTTIGSLAMFVSKTRRRTGAPKSPRTKSDRNIILTSRMKTEGERTGLDVSVEILDNSIQALKDVRSFLLDTVKENNVLKSKVDRFKRFFDND